MYCADGNDGDDDDLVITMCCMAITPECLACGAGMSVDDFCAMNPMPECSPDDGNNAMQAGFAEAMNEPLGDPFSLPGEIEGLL